MHDTEGTLTDDTMGADRVSDRPRRRRRLYKWYTRCNQDRGGNEGEGCILEVTRLSVDRSVKARP